MNARRAQFAVGLATLIVAACGESIAPPTPVAFVDVRPDTSAVVIGHTLQLTATVRDAAGNTLTGSPVTWTSGNLTKAIVSQTGLVTGLAPESSVVITATSGGKSGSAAVTVVIDVTGEWNFTERLTGTAQGVTVTCSDTGSFHFAQSGADIEGTAAHVGTCLGPFRSGDNTWSGPIADGRLSSTGITFRIGPDCRYDAGLIDPPTAVSGIVSCGNFTGTWAAVPGGAPVVSVNVRWDLQTVVGGAVQLVAVPRDVAGHVVGRPVSWSSDDESVARVSESGLATALAPGLARITASSETKSGSAAVAAEIVSFSSISTGLVHSCGVTASGKAYCWGYGGDGQVGGGVRTSARAPSASLQSPLAVAGGHVFATVSPGPHHSCAVTTGGEAYCWGDNHSGQLGDGSTTSNLLPVRVTGGQQFSSVTAGIHYSCGVTTANAAYCWGSNAQGQLGDGSGTRSLVPVRVAGDLFFQEVRAGLYHACGVTTANVAYCWGNNYYGQLGDGSTISRNRPSPVWGGHAFATLDAGWVHTCGVRTDGAAYCWGKASLLGDGSGLDRTAPVPVAGGRSFATAAGTIMVGQEHSCALTPTGAAYCWGHNDAGQLGDGSLSDRLTPVQASGGLSFTAISVGFFHTCGITTAGLAACWGLNIRGQLGGASAQSCSIFGEASPCSTTPVLVIGQPGAAAASSSSLETRVQGAEQTALLRPLSSGLGLPLPALVRPGSEEVP